MYVGLGLGILTVPPIQSDVATSIPFINGDIFDGRTASDTNPDKIDARTSSFTNTDALDGGAST